MLTIPHELDDMLRDLEQHHGFRRVREAEYGMCAARIEMESDDLRLTVNRDKFSHWGMEVAAANLPEKSYDLALVVSLLDGVQTDKVTLSDEIQFITKRLNTLADLFSERRRESTHARLHELGLQRWRGRISGLQA